MRLERGIAGWLLGMAALAGTAPEAGASGEIAVGAQTWHQTAPEAKYQEFTHFPQGSFIYSLFLEQGKDRNLLSIYSTNVLQKDQRAGLTWMSGARFRADVDYQQIPHNFSQVTRSPYTDAGNGRLVLDDPIQALNQAQPANYTQIMTSYLAASPNVAMAHRTDGFASRAQVRPARGWTVAGHYDVMHKSGTKAYGGAFGFNHAVEIWEPLNHKTTVAAVDANYQRNQFSLRLGAGISLFENRVSQITWDNPKRLTDTTASSLPGAAYVNGDASAAGQLDLYPDNQALHGEIALGWRLPKRTAVSASFRASLQEQTDEWLPYTVNSALPEPKDPANALPGTKTDAEATVLSGDLRLTSRVLGPVTTNARLRYHKFDNETASFTFPGYVRLDQAWVSGPITSHPYGNEQTKASVDLGYRPIARLHLEGGAEWTSRDHTFREVEQDEEVAAFGRARLQATQSVSVEAEYRYGNRVGEDFLIEHYENASGVLIEQPGLRRFDVANRRQQLAEGTVTWTPTAVSQVMAQAQYARNLYPDSELGLQDQILRGVLLDLTLDPSERLRAGGGGGYSRLDGDQTSRTSGGTVSTNPADNWFALLRDRNWFAYVDLTWWLLPDRLSAEPRYEFSWAEGEYFLTNPTNTAQSLPPTKYVRHLAWLDVRYEIWDNTSVGGLYAYDDYDVDDFANQNVPLLNPATSPTGPSNAIFLGDNSLPYTAHRGAVYLSRRF